MSNSIRTIEATSKSHDPINEISSSPVKDYPTARNSTSVSQIQLPPSPPAEIDLPIMGQPRPKGSPTVSSSMARERHRITRDLTRGSPGEQTIFSNAKSPEQKALAKRKSQYYGEVFANREPIASARERVLKESPIMADVRTNVIVRLD